MVELESRLKSLQIEIVSLAKEANSKIYLIDGKLIIEKPNEELSFESNDLNFLTSLINNELKADHVLKLTNNENQFYIHSKLISKRSNYFRQMFANFKEKGEGLIELLLPCERAPFLPILTFLYTGHFNLIDFPPEWIFGFLSNAEFLMVEELRLELINAMALDWKLFFLQPPESVLFRNFEFDMVKPVFENLVNAEKTTRWDLVYGAGKIARWDWNDIHDQLFCMIEGSQAEKIVWLDQLDHDALKVLFDNENAKLLFGLFGVTVGRTLFSKIDELTNEYVLLVDRERELNKKRRCKDCKLNIRVRDENEWCTHFYHDGNYKSGYTPGRTCCGETIKKSNGCKSKVGPHLF